MTYLSGPKHLRRSDQTGHPITEMNKRSGVASFLLVQILRPAGLLVQFAILSRALDPDEFSSFALLFNLAVLTSIVSDLGQRQVAFASVRRASPAEIGTIAGTAITLKIAGSAVLLLAIASCAAVGVIDLWSALALWIVSVSSPIGDPVSALLRGMGAPLTEARASALEQVTLVALAVAVLSLGINSSIVALIGFGLIGVLRQFVLLSVLVTMLGGTSGVHLRIPPPREIGVTLLAAASVFAAVNFERLPVLALAPTLGTAQFAVLGAVWPLVARSTLVVTAFVQAGYQRHGNTVGRLANSPRLLAAATFGMALVGGVALVWLAEPFVRLYLGADLVDGATIMPAIAFMALFYLPLFSVRLLLQFEGRHLLVLWTLAFAGAAVWVVSVSAPLNGLVVAVPYATAALLSLSVLLVAASRRKESPS